MKRRLVPGFLSLAILAGCSPSVPQREVQPDVTREQVSDEGQEVFDPSVDILFVVDDSGSMGVHQQNLTANVGRFISAFTSRAAIDYHIGVVTTSMGGQGSIGCCGRLVGSPAYVQKSTPNIVRALSRNLRVGTNGSTTEESFSPVLAALTPPLVNGVNAGFYRQSAHLAIVFLTDAEDQSSIDTDDFYDRLVALKGRPEKIISYGVIVPSNVYDCDRDERDVFPDRIESFLGKVANAGHNEFSLCDPTFGDRVAEIADSLVRYIGNVVYLKRAPVINSIHVRFGTQIIPQDAQTGWAFDATRTAVVFGDDVVWSTQAPGTKVQITYEAVDFPHPR